MRISLRSSDFERGCRFCFVYLLDDQTILAELVKVGDKLNGIKLPEDFVEKMAQMAIGNRKTDKALVGMCSNNGQINAEMEKLLHPEGKEVNK